MATRSLYFFATKPEMASVLEEFLSEHQELFALVWFWPPHSCSATDSHRIREHLARPNACEVLISNEPRQYAGPNPSIERYGEVDTWGHVVVEIPRVRDGVLEDISIVAKSTSSVAELQMDIPRPDVVEMFKKVTRPFRKILLKPLYETRSGTIVRWKWYTPGIRAWVEKGGKLKADGSTVFYTLEDPSDLPPERIAQLELTSDEIKALRWSE